MHTLVFTGNSIIVFVVDSLFIDLGLEKHSFESAEKKLTASPKAATAKVGCSCNYNSKTLVYKMS